MLRITQRLRVVADLLVHGRYAGTAVYVALFALLGLSAWSAIARPSSRVIELFAANLAAEVLGLIVTLVLVQRFLDRQERALRLRGSLGALRKSGRALTTMVDTWAELIKAGVERAPESRPPAPQDSV